MASTQYYDLSLVPESSIVRVHASQWDNGERKFIFTLYDENGLYTVPSGAVIELRATKADNHGYAVSSYESPEIVSYDGAQVTVVTERQMCAAAGEQDFKLSITIASRLVASARYTLVIDADTLSDDTDISDSYVPSIIDLATAQMEAAARSATLAESWAQGGTNSRTGEDTDNAKYFKEGSEAASEASEGFSEDSEAWARGTRNGTDVESSDPTYHNNSKYFAELSAASAQSSSNSASSSDASKEDSEAWAKGTKNGVDVPNTAPQYHDNSKYWSEQAHNSADRAEAYSVNVPYIGANGNWWVWDTTDGEYIDTGVDASITITVADVTMLEPTENPYITNTGTNTDPIFHLFIPRGKGIQSIAKTNTTVLTDTYTITYSDGATTTFTVVNGRGIDTISKTSTSGLIDTYTIAYNDNTTSTFTVTNGKTAYQSAVEGGYTGTEAEFEDDLAHFGEWKLDAEQAAQDAAQSASDAEDSAELSESFKNDAQDYADRANNSANLAGFYADILIPTFYIDFNTMELMQNDMTQASDITFSLDSNCNLLYSIASA